MTIPFPKQPATSNLNHTTCKTTFFYIKNKKLIKPSLFHVTNSYFKTKTWRNSPPTNRYPQINLHQQYKSLQCLKPAAVSVLQGNSSLRLEAAQKKVWKSQRQFVEQVSYNIEKRKKPYSKTNRRQSQRKIWDCRAEKRQGSVDRRRLGHESVKRMTCNGEALRRFVGPSRRCRRRPKRRPPRPPFLLI